MAMAVAISIQDIISLIQKVRSCFQGFSQFKEEVERILVTTSVLESILTNEEFASCFTNEFIRKEVELLVCRPLNLAFKAVEKYNNHRRQILGFVKEAFRVTTFGSKLKSAADSLEAAQKFLSEAIEQQQLIHVKHQRDLQQKQFEIQLENKEFPKRQLDLQQRQVDILCHIEENQCEMLQRLMDRMLMENPNLRPIDASAAPSSPIANRQRVVSYLHSVTKIGQPSSALSSLASGENSKVDSSSFPPLKFACDEIIALPGPVPPEYETEVAQVLSDMHELNLMEADICTGIVELIVKSSQMSFSRTAESIHSRVPKIARVDIRMGARLGFGANGVVFAAQWISKKMDVAVKCVQANEVTMREILLMFECRAPHIVHLYGINDEVEGEYWIVMERCKGSLYDLWINNNSKEIQMDWPTRWRYALEIVRAVDVLHSHTPPIIHRDIKSLNFLINEDNRIKLADFGSSMLRKVASDHPSMTLATRSFGGSDLWVAPEIAEQFASFNEAVFNIPTDMYSIGCVLMELAKLSVPHARVKTTILHGSKFPDDQSERDMWMIIRQCCDDDPFNRPSCSDLIELILSSGQIKSSSAPTSTSPRSAAETVRKAVSDCKARIATHTSELVMMLDRLKSQSNEDSLVFEKGDKWDNLGVTSLLEQIATIRSFVESSRWAFETEQAFVKTIIVESRRRKVNPEMFESIIPIAEYEGLCEQIPPALIKATTETEGLEQSCAARSTFDYCSMKETYVRTICLQTDSLSRNLEWFQSIDALDIVLDSSGQSWEASLDSHLQTNDDETNTVDCTRTMLFDFVTFWERKLISLTKVKDTILDVKQMINKLVSFRKSTVAAFDSSFRKLSELNICFTTNHAHSLSKQQAEQEKPANVLTDLALWNHKFGYDGCSALAESLEKVIQVLTELKLQDDEIGDLFCRALEESIKANQVVADLNLQNHKIGDGGCRTFPPGPFIYPLLGNLIQFGTDPTKTLTPDFCRSYGGVFSLYFGRIPAVIFASPQAIQQVFKGQGLKSSGRPNWSEYLNAACDCGRDILMSQANERWAAIRKFANFNVFRKQALIEIQAPDRIIKQLNTVYKDIDNDPDATKAGICIFDRSRFLFFNSMVDAIFSLDFGSATNATFKQQSDAWATVMLIAAVGRITDFMPDWMKAYANRGRAKSSEPFYQSIAIIRAFIKEHVDAAEAAIIKVKESVKDDQVKLLETYRVTNLCERFILQRHLAPAEERDGSADSWLDLHSIVLFLQNFIGGGADTAAGFVLWAVLLAANYPDKQARVQAELDAMLKAAGRDYPDESDEANCPYTRAFIHEVHRYKPLAAIIAHAANKDLTVTNDFGVNYLIPAGTTLLQLQSAVMADKKLWNDPESFRPERFVDVNQIEDLVNPFGVGPRTCPGQNLGQLNTWLVTAGLLYRYNIATVDCKQIDEEHVYGITLLPKPFKVTFNKRH